MSNPRQPVRKALVSGAASKNPKRYRGTAPGQKLPALGLPPASMTDLQKEAWRDFANTLPWLNKSHRAIVRLACVTRVRVETADAPGVNLLSAYSSILSKLGASPVDESRVNYAPDEDEDPAARFFQ